MLIEVALAKSENYEETSLVAVTQTELLSSKRRSDAGFRSMGLDWWHRQLPCNNDGIECRVERQREDK